MIATILVWILQLFIHSNSISGQFCCYKIPCWSIPHLPCHYIMSCDFWPMKNRRRYHNNSISHLEMCPHCNYGAHSIKMSDTQEVHCMRTTNMWALTQLWMRDNKYSLNPSNLFFNCVATCTGNPYIVLIVLYRFIHKLVIVKAATILWNPII